MSYARRSPDCGCAHFTAQEESVKRVSVPLGMFVGRTYMRAVSAGKVMGLIPRNNILVQMGITRMLA